MTYRVVKISGHMTDADIEDLIATVRRIDERNPQEVIAISVAGAEGDNQEAMDTLRSGLPFRATEFARDAYQSDAYPCRRCDRCGQPYRGPAAYCSLDCALADA